MRKGRGWGQAEEAVGRGMGGKWLTHVPEGSMALLVPKACSWLTLSAHTGWTHQAENPSSQLTSPVTLTPSRICLYETVNY